MNFKPEIVEYVQADQVGVNGVFEAKVSEFDETSDSLKVVGGLALSL